MIRPIPASFVLEKTTLPLVEARWAFDNGVIGAQVVVDIARAMRDTGDDSPVVARLAAVRHADLPSVREILSEVMVDAEEGEQARRRWLWVVLAWLYENQREDANVLDELDGIYADLGYPEEMASFGPYAPVYQAKGDPDEQRRAVFDEWRRYLSRGEESFGRARGGEDHHERR